MAVLETFHGLLSLAIDNGASDIHIKSNKPAFLRLSGLLNSVEMEAIPPEDVLDFIKQSVPEQFRDSWTRERQVDYSYQVENIGRFRVNAFLQRGLPSLVIRHVSDRPPTFEDLNVDGHTLSKLCEFKNGIVILCGATGSGKSSTLAAMINHINHGYDRHIVTLEDPIEFTYTDQKSIVSQREVGLDCSDFAAGMKAVLRQDPDVILVGEMRDLYTVETALQAAETGHLVLCTLHASNSQQALQRLLEFFPAVRHAGLQRQIASTLLATITQKLMPASDGDGRYPVSESMVVDSLARKTIMEGHFEKLEAVIETNEKNGSKTFNQDLYRLVKDGKISKQSALEHSSNPNQLEMNLKGIFLSTGGIVN